MHNSETSQSIRDIRIVFLNRMGVLACYLNPEELHPFLQASPLSTALWQQLAQCVSEGLISATGRVRETQCPVVTELFL